MAHGSGPVRELSGRVDLSILCKCYIGMPTYRDNSGQTVVGKDYVAGYLFDASPLEPIGQLRPC